MKICGIEIDDPRPDGYLGYAPCRVYKDGKRTTVHEMWMTEYIQTGPCAWEMAGHCLTMTNRGACEMDGKPVKDETDKQNFRELFEWATQKGFFKV